MPWWGTSTTDRVAAVTVYSERRLRRSMAGILLACFALPACAVDVGLDAPSPADPEPVAAESATKASPEAAGEPAWLGEPNAGVPAAPPAPGLVPDSAAKAHSGETLTSTGAYGTDGMGKPAEPVPMSDRLVIAKPPPGGPAVNTHFAALPNVTGYRVQLATLRNPDAAGRAWHDLVARFPDILGDKRLFVVDLDLGYRGVQHRIEAGPYRTLESAWQACLSLMSRMQGCTVSLP